MGYRPWPLLLAFWRDVARADRGVDGQAGREGVHRLVFSNRPRRLLDAAPARLEGGVIRSPHYRSGNALCRCGVFIEPLTRPFPASGPKDHGQKPRPSHLGRRSRRCPARLVVSRNATRRRTTPPAKTRSQLVPTLRTHLIGTAIFIIVYGKSGKGHPALSLLLASIVRSSVPFATDLVLFLFPLEVFLLALGPLGAGFATGFAFVVGCGFFLIHDAARKGI